MVCLNCKSNSKEYGEGNLGPLLTPEVKESKPLCRFCWEIVLSQAHDVASWQQIVKDMKK